MWEPKCEKVQKTWVGLKLKHELEALEFENACLMKSKDCQHTLVQMVRGDRTHDCNSFKNWEPMDLTGNQRVAVGEVCCFNGGTLRIRYAAVFWTFCIG